ncbi:MAG: cycA 2 [Pedosphaera sp.]|nr:cycA 2 [Pedosphaera sp.]
MSVEPNKASPMAMDEGGPKTGWSPTPVLLVGLLGLLIYWGMLHLEDHAGEFNAQVYEPYTSFKMVYDLQPRDPDAIRKLEGQKIYNTTCAACHQATGLGSAAINAPPLAGSEWVNAEGPNRVIRIVLNGLKGPVTVKGQAYGAGLMAHWRDVYTDEQLAGILTFIRQNKDWGNNAPAITPAQVKAIRDKTAKRSLDEAWTADELLKIPEKD